MGPGRRAQSRKTTRLLKTWHDIAKNKLLETLRVLVETFLHYEKKFLRIRMCNVVISLSAYPDSINGYVKLEFCNHAKHYIVIVSLGGRD
jgi:hypothetical protein